MRPIQKGPEPPELSVWRSQQSCADLEKWTTKDGADPSKVALRDAMVMSLRQEQGYACCYCGGRIGPGQDHIEHFCPKGEERFRHLTFSWLNLLSSCNSGQLAKEPRHCGAAKAEWYTDAIVDPRQANCEERIRYRREDGAAVPAAADQGAQETIVHLNLDCKTLREKRLGVIDEYLSGDQAAWSQLLAALENRDAHGHFIPYSQVVVFLIKQELRAQPQPISNA